MKKNIKTFYLKCLLLAAPLLLLFIIYVVRDPFMVLRHYDCYDDSPFVLNEHFVGWKSYENRHDRALINSFIMGNSCTMAFSCNDWESYLGKGNQAFRLFGNAETLENISLKLKALEQVHAPIKHLLLVVDHELLGCEIHGKGIYRLLPPEEAKSGKGMFQITFFQSFLSPQYLVPYCDYCMFRCYRKSMRGIINPYGCIRNPHNCDARNPREREIMRKGERYWTDHKDEFPPRKSPGTIDPAVLHPDKCVYLQEIAALCRRHRADVKVIISPNYHQHRLNPVDVSVLRHFFGSANVYDFTGINAYSSDIHNFFEETHYRRILGRQLLKVVYGKKETM